jgi:hypothetical protein
MSSNQRWIDLTVTGRACASVDLGTNRSVSVTINPDSWGSAEAELQWGIDTEYDTDADILWHSFANRITFNSTTPARSGIDCSGGVKKVRLYTSSGDTASEAEAESWIEVAPEPARPFEDSSTGPVKTALFRYLDTAGDGTGTKNANGDYSSTSDIFYIQPAAGQVFRMVRMIVTVEDTTGMQAAEYGNLGSALSNGITVRTQDDSGTILDMTDGLPVTTNAEWARLCYDADVKSWGAGNELLTVRWTFARSGTLIRLRGDQNERLEVFLNDDLTGLIQHYFMVQGHIE